MNVITKKQLNKNTNYTGVRDHNYIRGGTNINPLMNFNDNNVAMPDRAQINRNFGTIQRSNKSGRQSTFCSESASATNSTLRQSTIYLAITEGRELARGEIGLAAIDINSPVIILSQFSDDCWYTGLLAKINLFEPIEIIVPDTFQYNLQNSKLLDYVENTFPQQLVTSIARRHFKHTDGAQLIDKLCATKYENIKLTIAKKYYTLASVAALIKYVEYKLNITFAANTLKMEYENRDGRMMIDLDTAHHLELLYPLCLSTEKRSCLFGILNHCITIIGKRNLRAKILEPNCDVNYLNKMHASIRELAGNVDQLAELQECLKPFASVDKLVKICFHSTKDKGSPENVINQMLHIKQCLQRVPELCQAISKLKSPIFCDIGQVLKDQRYSNILDIISEVLQSELQTCGSGKFFQRLFAIKPGINALLDVTRNVYSTIVNEVTTTINELSHKHNLPFRTWHTTSRGFHIQLVLTKGITAEHVPANLNILSKNRNKMFLINDDLMKLNSRLNSVIHEIQLFTYIIMADLRTRIRKDIDVIYDLTGIISAIDIILSLTKSSTVPGYCCPKFGTENRIINGVHPLLEYSKTKTYPQPIPNNVIATSEYNFFIITGPNMGGKTVYLKMIAILQIMAQIGCFVPAKSAEFRICDRLYARIGFNDNIEQNLSSFVKEIREMEYIFKTITANSLVIVDELCRNTNPNEGISIAWNICERLANYKGKLNKFELIDENVDNNQTPKNISTISSLTRINVLTVTAPFIFYTTHFLEICKLADRHFNVVNLNFSAITQGLQLTYTHTIKEGVTPITGYGLALACTVNFPKSVIKRAEQILNQIKPSEPQNNNAVINATRLSNPINRTISSILPPTTTTTTATNSTDTDAIYTERCLYDLFANIATIIRSNICDTKGQASIELNSLLHKFEESQPNEFIDICRNRTVTDYFNSSMLFSRNIESERQYQSSYMDGLSSTTSNEVMNSFGSNNIGESSVRHNRKNRNILSRFSQSERQYQSSCLDGLSSTTRPTSNEAMSLSSIGINNIGESSVRLNRKNNNILSQFSQSERQYQSSYLDGLSSTTRPTSNEAMSLSSIGINNIGERSNQHNGNNSNILSQCLQTNYDPITPQLCTKNMIIVETNNMVMEQIDDTEINPFIWNIENSTLQSTNTDYNQKSFHSIQREFKNELFSTNEPLNLFMSQSDGFLSPRTLIEGENEIIDFLSTCSNNSNDFDKISLVSLSSSDSQAESMAKLQKSPILEMNESELLKLVDDNKRNTSMISTSFVAKRNQNCIFNSAEVNDEPPSKKSYLKSHMTHNQMEIFKKNLLSNQFDEEFSIATSNLRQPSILENVPDIIEIDDSKEDDSIIDLDSFTNTMDTNKSILNKNHNLNISKSSINNRSTEPFYSDQSITEDNVVVLPSSIIAQEIYEENEKTQSEINDNHLITGEIFENQIQSLNSNDENISIKTGNIVECNKKSANLSFVDDQLDELDENVQNTSLELNDLNIILPVPQEFL